ncbi:hypothetical protein MAR_033404 [Mya arenaria]|uniref:Uncharacterized protein n=1 Tax=Mya arenaria TaxID=6604 RepID=A0ABY7G8W6_MYAAR|nr:hypothetical protein MAR_033404 [Mya arenaria]
MDHINTSYGYGETTPINPSGVKNKVHLVKKSFDIEINFEKKRCEGEHLEGEEVVQEDLGVEIEAAEGGVVVVEIGVGVVVEIGGGVEVEGVEGEA